MKGPRTFGRGGVWPRDKKDATARLPIKNAHIPAVAVLPLSQHAGAPAQSIVNSGDEVKEGMLVARASGFVSANIHSPVPGRVREIRDIILPQGTRSQEIITEGAAEFDGSGKVQ